MVWPSQAQQLLKQLAFLNLNVLSIGALTMCYATEWTRGCNNHAHESHTPPPPLPRSNTGAIECFFATTVFSDYLLTTASAIVIVGALTLQYNVIACCLRLRLRWVESCVCGGR